MLFLTKHSRKSGSLEMNGKTVEEDEGAIWRIEHCNRNRRGNNYANCYSAEMECVGRNEKWKSRKNMRKISQYLYLKF